MTGIFQRRETVEVRAKKRLIHKQWYTMIHVLYDTPSNFGVDSASLASQTHFCKIKGKGLVNCVYKLCPTGMQLDG